MGISISSNFDMAAALPLDSRLVVADNTARDAIVSGIRYEGMIVYSVASATNYQLVGGTDNANWVELSGGGSGSGVVVVADYDELLNLPDEDRSEGMIVYITDTMENVQFRGGIDDLDIQLVTSSRPNTILGTDDTNAPGGPAFLSELTYSQDDDYENSISQRTDEGALRAVTVADGATGDHAEVLVNKGFASPFRNDRVEVATTSEAGTKVFDLDKDVLFFQGSEVDAFTLTLPSFPTGNTQGRQIAVYFECKVRTLTINAGTYNAGANNNLLSSPIPNTAKPGDCMRFAYEPTEHKWYMSDYKTDGMDDQEGVDVTGATTLDIKSVPEQIITVVPDDFGHALTVVAGNVRNQKLYIKNGAVLGSVILEGSTPSNSSNLILKNGAESIELSHSEMVLFIWDNNGSWCQF